MRKHLFLFLLIILLLPAILMAADESGGVSQPSNIWLLLAPIIATVITSYGVRIFKWLGIPIEDHLLYPILVKLIEIIAKVEASGGSGSEKKLNVVNLAKSQLKGSELKLLNRRFGNLETAVQAAFEMSSTAKRSQ